MRVQRLCSTANDQGYTFPLMLLLIQQIKQTLLRRRTASQSKNQISEKRHSKMSSQRNHMASHSWEYFVEAQSICGKGPESSRAYHAVREAGEEVVSRRIQILIFDEFDWEIVAVVVPPRPVSNPFYSVTRNRCLTCNVCVLEPTEDSIRREVPTYII